MHDVLIKEIGWERDLEKTAESLSPKVVLIVRHPCAVVCSLLKGQRRGLIPGEHREHWLSIRQHECSDLGFRSSTVLAMNSHEFSALRWLLENYAYQSVLERCPNSHVVVYEQLCQEPLKIASRHFDFLGWPMELETERFINDSTGIHQSLQGFLNRIMNRYFGVYRNTIRVAESWKSELPVRVQKSI